MPQKMDGLFILAQRLDATPAAGVFSLGSDDSRTLSGKKRHTGAANRTRDTGYDGNLACNAAHGRHASTYGRVSVLDGDFVVVQPLDDVLEAFDALVHAGDVDDLDNVQAAGVVMVQR